MALNFLRQGAFAAAMFAAVTLHGPSTAPVDSGGPGVGYVHQPQYRPRIAVKSPKIVMELQETEDEEAVILALLTCAAQQFYT
jgi:hypothetical protein